MKRATSAQEKLFETAARLFYQHGYQATGVDTIAAESGVGKMTLYRHYPSKADLIEAFLRDSDTQFWEEFDKATADATTAREKLLAFFENLQEYVLSPACYGCPFLNVTAEFPEAGAVGHRAAIEHKQAVQKRFQQLAEAAGARRPEALADALFLLMDGAYMAARTFGSTPGSPAAHLAEAARHLVAVHCEAEPG